MLGHRTALRAAAIGVLLFFVSLLSCGREITGPVTRAGEALGRRVAAFAVDPVYEVALPVALRRAALAQVAFERVRITIRREDGSIALDTVVTFPVGADSLALTLEVPLLPNTPASGVPMSLRMGYVTAAGDTVFRGAAALTVAPSSPGGKPAAITVPVTYTGPGAGAVAVRIAPPSVTGMAGSSVTFSAAALDAAGNAIPNTPIVFSSSDATIATIDAVSGVATLGQRRGSATITAQTLTGQRASATVSVTLPGSVLTAAGGGTAAVGAKLPVTATVTASDGLAVAGVSVSFAVASGGGTVAPASATTDASGKASATWTLGLTPGGQSLTVSAAGATRTLSATAEALKASKIVVTSSPGNGVLGGTFGLTAQVQDSLGGVVKDFTGTLTVALGTNPAGAALGGTTSAVVSGGTATFSGLSVSKAGKGFVLVVSGGGLAAGSSRAFDVAGPTATKLAFTGRPPASAKAGEAFSVAVAAQDSSGTVATDFSEPVGLQASGGPGSLLGTTSVVAGGGTAAFEGLKIDKPGTYTLTARAGTLTPATATMVVATGDPTQFRLVRGQSQIAPAGTTLSPITVRLLDAAGNGVPGRLVTFTVTLGGGTLASAAPPTLALATLETITDGSPATFTTTTNAAGEASVTWTLGPTVGAQSITASTPGVPEYNIGATATTPPPGTMTVYGGNNQFAAANTAVLTPPSVLVKDNAGQPKSGVVVTFTPSAGSSLVGAATATSGADGVAVSSGWRLGASGVFTLTASAAGYNNVVFTGTANAITLNVAAAEKLPNGTQQFSVVGGNPSDTYTWTVNNVVGGNSTYGTVSGSGFYTAPSAVPNPATTTVCAQSVQHPSSKGCANVTITTTPSAGGELVVMNDVNWGDECCSLGLSKSGADYVYPGNAQFVKNLVNFTTTGVRRTAKKVLFVNDNCMRSLTNVCSYNWPEVQTLLAGEGYTTIETTLHTDLSNVPADVKLVILMMPAVAFTVSEINGLKSFASQGGRIFYVGENGSYYAYGISLQNTFMLNMGAQLTNTGSCDASGNTLVTPRTHTLTTGITDFMMNCVSRINLGPNDFALMTTTSFDSSVGTPPAGYAVVAAIAKIDYSPITTLLSLPSLRMGVREAGNAMSPAEQLRMSPNGTASGSSGPPRLP